MTARRALRHKRIRHKASAQPRKRSTAIAFLLCRRVRSLPLLLSRLGLTLKANAQFPMENLMKSILFNM